MSNPHNDVRRLLKVTRPLAEGLATFIEEAERVGVDQKTREFKRLKRISTRAWNVICELEQNYQ